jgi:hypothetical protein
MIFQVVDAVIAQKWGYLGNKITWILVRTDAWADAQLSSLSHSPGFQIRRTFLEF